MPIEGGLRPSLFFWMSALGSLKFRNVVRSNQHNARVFYRPEQIFDFCHAFDSRPVSDEHLHTTFPVHVVCIEKIFESFPADLAPHLSASIFAREYHDIPIEIVARLLVCKHEIKSLKRFAPPAHELEQCVPVSRQNGGQPGCQQSAPRWAPAIRFLPGHAEFDGTFLCEHVEEHTSLQQVLVSFCIPGSATLRNDQLVKRKTLRRGNIHQDTSIMQDYCGIRFMNQKIQKPQWLSIRMKRG